MLSQKRILFVDDEIGVLTAIKNVFRRETSRWDMVFAGGPKEALTELAKGPFDVVVSDVRMPEMDGPELLARVKDNYPATARIILSGCADDALLRRALPVAHQFLSKPWEMDDLRRTIERTCGLHVFIESESVRRVVGRLERLPSLPETYITLCEASRDPRVGFAELARIVESDSAICAKVLQLANSAFFGSGERVVSMHRAVSMLGSQLLKDLVLTAQIFGMEGKKVEGFSLASVQAHSVKTATLAKQFLAAPGASEEAFTAALLHEVGRIVISLGLPNELATIVREAHATAQPLHVVEKEVLGASHAEIGAYLLGLWGLPFSIVEAVAYHHRPSEAAEGSSEILAAVHVASTLAETSEVAGRKVHAEANLDLAFLERIGLIHKLGEWRAIADRDAAERN